MHTLWAIVNNYTENISSLPVCIECGSTLLWGRKAYADIRLCSGNRLTYACRMCACLAQRQFCMWLSLTVHSGVKIYVSYLSFLSKEWPANNVIRTIIFTHNIQSLIFICMINKLLTNFNQTIAKDFVNMGMKTTLTIKYNLRFIHCKKISIPFIVGH